MISLKWVVGAAALSTCLASGAFATSPNLFVNGDFEAGNSGFASSYTYSPHFIAGSKTYDIVSDPKLSHGGAVSFHDHTTGTGLMLAAELALARDDELDVLAEQARHHRAHPRDDLVQVDDERLQHLLAAEGEQLAGELGGPPAAGRAPH